jgi:hypothetical protein
LATAEAYGGTDTAPKAAAPAAFRTLDNHSTELQRTTSSHASWEEALAS